jgi:hypothetical protein
VVVADVRKQEAWDEAERIAEGARRLSPEHPVDDARILGLPSDAWIILYCT